MKRTTLYLEPELERALAIRCVWPNLRCDPRLDGIRTDLRVRAVFEHVRPHEAFPLRT